jgi:hypothetical protein
MGTRRRCASACSRGPGVAVAGLPLVSTNTLHTPEVQMGRMVGSLAIVLVVLAALAVTGPIR